MYSCASSLPARIPRISVRHGPGCTFHCTCDIPGLDPNLSAGENHITAENLMAIPLRRLLQGRSRRMDGDPLSVTNHRTYLSSIRRNSRSHHEHEHTPGTSNRSSIATLESLYRNRSSGENGLWFQSPVDQQRPQYSAPLKVSSQETPESLSSELLDEIPPQSYIPRENIPPKQNQPPGLKQLEELVLNRFYFARSRGAVVPALPFPQWTLEDQQKLMSISSTGTLLHSNVKCDFCGVEFDFVNKLVLGLGCGHVFHSQCLVLWLKRSFNCAKCFRSLRFIPGEKTTEEENENQSEGTEGNEGGNADSDITGN